MLNCNPGVYRRVVTDWVAAEPRAQASARVAGTCWSMGAGLGRVLAAPGLPRAGLGSVSFQADTGNVGLRADTDQPERPV